MTQSGNSASLPVSLSPHRESGCSQSLAGKEAQALEIEKARRKERTFREKASSLSSSLGEEEEGQVGWRRRGKLREDQGARKRKREREMLAGEYTHTHSQSIDSSHVRQQLMRRGKARKEPEISTD